MTLPQLLRRLEQSAAGRDARGVRDTLAQLGENAGWSGQVIDFVARMPARAAAFVQDMLAPPPAAAPMRFATNERGLGGTGGRVGTGGNPMTSVTRDATSLIYCPATAAEWTTTMSVAGLSSGNPSLLWLSQEASGDLTDSIGTFTGTASGWNYQQAVTGWTRSAVSADVASARIIFNAAAGLPDINTASCLVLTYHSFPAVEAPAGYYSLVTMGPTFGSQIAANISGTAKLTAVVDPNSAAGAADPRNAVHPIVIRVNRTGGNAAVYTDQEKLTAALDATPTGKKIAIGGDNVNYWTEDGGGYLYTAAFFNAAAELSDAQVKTLLQTLGWTVAW